MGKEDMYAMDHRGYEGARRSVFVFAVPLFAITFTVVLLLVWLMYQIYPVKKYAFHPFLFMDFPLFHGFAIWACALSFLVFAYPQLLNMERPQQAKTAKKAILVLCFFQMLLGVYDTILLALFGTLPSLPESVLMVNRFLWGNNTHWMASGVAIFSPFVPQAAANLFSGITTASLMKYLLCIQLPTSLYYCSKVFLFFCLVPFFLRRNSFGKTCFMVGGFVLFLHPMLVSSVFYISLKPLGLFSKGWDNPVFPLAQIVYLLLFGLIIFVQTYLAWRILGGLDGEKKVGGFADPEKEQAH